VIYNSARVDPARQIRIWYNVRHDCPCCVDAFRAWCLSDHAHPRPRVRWVEYVSTAYCEDPTGPHFQALCFDCWRGLPKAVRARYARKYR
jgi:hypothetical protein